ncbi:MAG: hypothetical protein KAS23_06350, partial [Anaerohalosphaera sp.]|nr:hypothetical protein [Anaerohalosphaera sp.]
IELLPALPEVWKTGRVKGLRARGGFEIDIEWEGGKLKEAVIKSLAGRKCELRYGETTVSLDMQKGRSRSIGINSFN